MVQKLEPKRRGRPPAYDADRALSRAMDAFWQAGYAATSLDELSAATGMNRPSLYGAFGDKHEIYLTTLERYRAFAGDAVKETLAYELPLREALRRFYDKALSIYLSGETGPRGCYAIGTATTEALRDPAVRGTFLGTLHEIDAGLEARIRFAQEHGETTLDREPTVLAKLASAFLHTLALRSRGGESRTALQAIADMAVELICGPAPSARGSGRKAARAS